MEKFDYKSKKGNFTECEIDYLFIYLVFSFSAEVEMVVGGDSGGISTEKKIVAAYHSSINRTIPEIKRSGQISKLMTREEVHLWLENIS